MSFLIILLSFPVLQPPLEFQNLIVTHRHRIKQGDWLEGICCDESKLYCVERQRVYGRLRYRSILAVYDISRAGDESPRLLDKMEVGAVSPFCRPRVDRHSHRVYVQCYAAGVQIFRLENNQLLPVGKLGCVKDVVSVAVNTADTVFVCDRDTKSVCLVSVSADTVIMQLETPEQVQGERPRRVAVLGETILVCYGDNILVAYNRNSPTTGQVLQTPEGLQLVYSITTDNYSSFLITDYSSAALFVLDDRGYLHHRIIPDAGAATDNSRLLDCAVVQSQLWLGYEGVSIVVMSSH